MRELTDDVGTTWLVYAIVPDSYDDRIGFAEGYERGWLCFQSPAEKWRYPSIPSGWELLDDDALLGLRSGARRVEARLLEYWNQKGELA